MLEDNGLGGQASKRAVVWGGGPEEGTIKELGSSREVG